MSHSRMYARARREARERELIASVGRAVNSNIKLEAIFGRVAEEVAVLIPYDRLFFALIEESGADLQIEYRKGDIVPKREWDEILSRYAERDGGGNYKWRRALITDYSAGSVSAGIEANSARSIIEVTLGSPDTGPMGYLSIRSAIRGKYVDSDVDLLERIAAHTTPAIENSRLISRTHSIAVLEERTRVSREIHDSVAQALGALVWQVDELEDSINQDGADTQSLLGNVRRAATAALLDARRAVWNLRPEPLHGQALTDALRHEIGRIADAGKLRWRLAIEGTPQVLSPAIDLSILRIAQELAVNSVRHANASTLRVLVRYEDDQVILTMVDDGDGFDPDIVVPTSSAGFGIIGIRERASQIDGSFTIESEKGNGTSVEFRVPISNRNGDET